MCVHESKPKQTIRGVQVDLQSRPDIPIAIARLGQYMMLRGFLTLDAFNGGVDEPFGLSIVLCRTPTYIPSFRSHIDGITIDTLPAVIFPAACMHSPPPSSRSNQSPTSQQQ